jgi:HlyD family secretion protein
MRKIIIIAALALIAAGTWWKLRQGNGFLYAGTIEAVEVDVSARITGVISEYKAAEGGTVAKNAVIAELDCGDTRLAADISLKDYVRAGELFTAGSLSKENYDRAKYRADDAVLRQSWCRIASPVSGTMLYKYHEKGELVSPGTKIATVADLSEVYAYIYVPHDIVVKLSTGMELNGLLPEAGNRLFPGKITVINQEAEFTPKNVQTRSARTSLVFGVKATFQNPDRLLKPGMTIEVKLPD